MGAEFSSCASVHVIDIQYCSKKSRIGWNLLSVELLLLPVGVGVGVEVWVSVEESVALATDVELGIAVGMTIAQYFSAPFLFHVLGKWIKHTDVEACFLARGLVVGDSIIVHRRIAYLLQAGSNTGDISLADGFIVVNLLLLVHTSQNTRL